MKNPATFLLISLVFVSVATIGAMPAAAQIQVNSASPNSTAQGTVNLNVIISGNGFKKGATAQWFVSGTTNPGGVTVNSTAFKNPGQLTANITVAANAATGNFDIQVTNTGGRTGKGTELFAVKSKTAASCPAPAPLNPAPLAVACSSASGTTCLDATFGNSAQVPPGGLVVTNTDGTVPWTNDSDSASAAKQQLDEKLVTFGTTTNPNVYSAQGAAVVRYNTDGSLDTSFGSGGIFKFFPAGNVQAAIYDGLIDNIGNLLTVGTENNSMFLLRLTPIGALDPSFNSVGYVILPNFIAYTMRLQTDGKIVVAGLSYDKSGSQIGLVVRVNTNGTLDTTFGTNGQVAISAFFILHALEFQSQSSQQYILVGGSSPANVSTVVRLTPSGSLDSSFGTSGIATTTFCGGFTSSINTLSVDPNSGSILTGGRTEVSSDGLERFALARFTSNGALDTTFGDPSTTSPGRTGQTLLDFFNYKDHLNSIQPVVDGSGNEIGFVVGGTAWQYTGSNSPLNNYMVLAKYHADGSIDTTFGTNGGVAISLGNNNSAGSNPGTSNTLIQADGKFVMVGIQTFSSGTYAGTNFAVARLWP